MKQIERQKSSCFPISPYVFIALFATKLGQACAAGSRRGLFAKGAAHHGGLRRRVPIGAAQLPPHRPVRGRCRRPAHPACRLRQGEERAGSSGRISSTAAARWGNAEDITPYVDPDLCQQRHSHPDGAADHEQPTQRTRKRRGTKTCWWWAAPAAARRGFSSSPISCRLHSSYVVTDPKGSIAGGVRKMLMLQRNEL